MYYKRLEISELGGLKSRQKSNKTKMPKRRHDRLKQNDVAEHDSDFMELNPVKKTPSVKLFTEQLAFKQKRSATIASRGPSLSPVTASPRAKKSKRRKDIAEERRMSSSPKSGPGSPDIKSMPKIPSADNGLSQIAQMRRPHIIAHGSDDSTTTDDDEDRKKTSLSKLVVLVNQSKQFKQRHQKITAKQQDQSQSLLANDVPLPLADVSSLLSQSCQSDNWQSEYVSWLDIDELIYCQSRNIDMHQHRQSQNRRGIASGNRQGTDEDDYDEDLPDISFNNSASQSAKIATPDKRLRPVTLLIGDDVATQLARFEAR